MTGDHATPLFRNHGITHRFTALLRREGGVRVKKGVASTSIQETMIQRLRSLSHIKTNVGFFGMQSTESALTVSASLIIRNHRKKSWNTTVLGANRVRRGRLSGKARNALPQGPCCASGGQSRCRMVTPACLRMNGNSSKNSVPRAGVGRISGRRPVSSPAFPPGNSQGSRNA